MILIESEYELGQNVYLKTDSEQKKRMVKQICLSGKGVEYNLVCGTESTWHSDFEINKDSDVLVQCGVDKKTA